MVVVRKSRSLTFPDKNGHNVKIKDIFSFSIWKENKHAAKF